MKDSGLTQGGTERSLDDGFRSFVSGTGSSRSRSTMRELQREQLREVLRRGRDLDGRTATEYRESGWTPVGLILRGSVFVSGTIAEDGTFTRSSGVSAGLRRVRTLLPIGGVSMVFAESIDRAAARRSSTARSTDSNRKEK